MREAVGNTYDDYNDPPTLKQVEQICLDARGRGFTDDALLHVSRKETKITRVEFQWQPGEGDS